MGYSVVMTGDDEGGPFTDGPFFWCSTPQLASFRALAGRIGPAYVAVAALLKDGEVAGTTALAVELHDVLHDPAFAGDIGLVPFRTLLGVVGVGDGGETLKIID